MRTLKDRALYDRYCLWRDAIHKEFDAINGHLSQEEIEKIWRAFIYAKMETLELELLEFIAHSEDLQWSEQGRGVAKSIIMERTLGL